MLDQVQLPSPVSDEARSLTSGLLEIDPRRRLGSSDSPHGALRDHAFFSAGRKVNWKFIDDCSHESINSKVSVGKVSVPSIEPPSSHACSSDSLGVFQRIGRSINMIHVSLAREREYSVACSEQCNFLRTYDTFLLDEWTARFLQPLSLTFARALSLVLMTACHGLLSLRSVKTRIINDKVISFRHYPFQLYTPSASFNLVV